MNQEAKVTNIELLMLRFMDEAINLMNRGAGSYSTSRQELEADIQKAIREHAEALRAEAKEVLPPAVPELPRWRCHMPQWLCHKEEVEAAKVGWIEYRDDGGAKLMLITPDKVWLAPIEVSAEFVRRNAQILVGGYYVAYKDGDARYSSAPAFEEGYTRI